MTGKNKVELRIAGKDYTVVGTEPEEYIHKVGHYIDKKMCDIMRCSSTLSTSLAAVLTAINIGDDLLKCKESEAELKQQLKKAQEELERLREDNACLTRENSALAGSNTNLKLELAKREAELGEVRNSLEKVRQG